MLYIHRILIDRSAKYQLGWIGRSLGTIQYYPLPRCPFFFFSFCLFVFLFSFFYILILISYDTYRPFSPLKSVLRYPIGWRGCRSPVPDWVRDNFGTLEAILLVLETTLDGIFGMIVASMEYRMYFVGIKYHTLGPVMT